MKSEFYTIEKNTETEYTEKKSRFIGRVFKISSLEEAAAFIEGIKKEYWNASHNVFAYKLKENGIQRFSDDGEPSGTAGKPVLEVLNKKQLENVLVIVTRYFGGIKLGASGLCRAYGKCASLSVDAAGIIRRELSTAVELETDYKTAGAVEKYLTDRNIMIRGIDYTDSVMFNIYISNSGLCKCKEELVNLSNGKIRIEQGRELYI